MMATERYVADVGGFGCGKSVGVGAKVYNLSRINAGFDGMLVSRTSNQLEKLMNEVFMVFGMFGMTYDDSDIGKFYRTAQPESYTTYGNRKVIICWQKGIFSTLYLGVTENHAYKKWAGGNMAFVVIDEIDTMPHAEEVWRFANDRVRVKAPLLQTACASTPEGYGFLWDFFENQPKKNPELQKTRRLIRGCTFDNPNLDLSYVKSQIQTRDPASLRAYVYGEFVNLEGALVYYRFDKDRNQTTKTLNDFPTNQIAHVGVDFNKNINAANISFVQNNTTYTVLELHGSTDVDALIARLRQTLAGRPIMIYPDGSGFEGIQQLKRAFGENSVHYHNANPEINKRVAAVNRRLMSDQGQPQAFINANTCPTLFNGLMRQVRDKDNKPDKTKGLDHQLDGYGYFTYWHWPTEEQRGSLRVIAGQH